MNILKDFGNVAGYGTWLYQMDATKLNFTQPIILTNSVDLYLVHWPVPTLNNENGGQW
jgi:hypothetical protein